MIHRERPEREKTNSSLFRIATNLDYEEAENPSLIDRFEYQRYLIVSIRRIVSGARSGAAFERLLQF